MTASKAGESGTPRVDEFADRSIIDALSSKDMDQAALNRQVFAFARILERELVAAEARAAEVTIIASNRSMALEVLRAKLSAAELDAGRYRQTRTMPFVLDTSRITPLRPDKFDQLIDAALRRSAP